MAKHWIVKSEPSAYSFADLERDGRAVWDGVRNAQALIHLRAMKVGDRVAVYHSGADKAIVGLATVARGAFRDPAADDPKLVAVELAAGRALPTPITLAAIRAAGTFDQLALVRQPRLSVMPVSAGDWRRLLAMATVD